MTPNALKYQENKLKEQELGETARANRAKEAENYRSNRAREDETVRTNKANERIKKNVAFTTAMNDTAGNIINLYKAGGDRLKSAGSILSAVNDYGWYTKFDLSLTSLLENAIHANAGRGEYVNTRASLYTTPSTNVTLGRSDPKQSVFVYEFIPYVGDCGDDDSACSMAVRQLNKTVRGANSGATNYDAADLFQFILSLDSLVTIIAWIERGLRIANFVRSRDASTKKDFRGLLYSHCFNNSNLVNDFIDNRASIISMLNSKIDEIEELNIPFELDYVKRHAWLAGSVFADGEFVSANYQIFNPSIYYIYEEGNALLRAHSFVSVMGSAGSAVTALKSVLTPMITSLLDSSAIQTMSGDIEKAFPGSQLHLNKYPLDFTEEPLFVSDVKYLQSIKNMTVVPLATSPTSGTLTPYDIVQHIKNGNPIISMGDWSGRTDDSWLGLKINSTNYSHPDATGSNLVTDKTSIVGYNYFDYYDGSVITPEDTAYNLSFACDKVNLQDPAPSTAFSDYLRGARSEIVWRFHYVNLNTSVNGYLSQSQRYYSSNFEDIAQSSGGGIVFPQIQSTFDLLKMATFRFVPKIMVRYAADFVTGEQQELYIWNRNYNRREFTDQLIEDINKECLKSLFYPVPGKSNSKVKRNKRR